MNDHNKDDRLITMQEFADILGIQLDTLYKKYRKNPDAFPAPVRSDILKEKRFLLSEVWAWIKNK